MSNKISAEDFYNKFAVSYDETLKNPDCNARQVYEGKNIFAKYHHQEREGRILDIGCGTGFLSQLLEGNFEYTGIDISQEMLQIAAQRGYRTIHGRIEECLVELDSQSYDFVFSLSSLLFVEDIQAALKELHRIARKAVILSLDNTTEEYIKNFAVTVYNHSQIAFPNAKEDYWILGWTSPTLGIPIYTRMIYEIPRSNPN